MARCFVNISEEEIEEALFYPHDLVNTKTTIPLRVGEQWWMYTSTLFTSPSGDSCILSQPLILFYSFFFPSLILIIIGFSLICLFCNPYVLLGFYFIQISFLLSLGYVCYYVACLYQHCQMRVVLIILKFNCNF